MENQRIKNAILLARFKVMQRKIMIDYYHGFLENPEFAKRQGTKTMTKGDCVKNGVLHLAFVLKYLEEADDKLGYFKVTGRNYTEMICSRLRV